MTLIATIKLEQLQARKTRDLVKGPLLTTLLGDLQTLAKNAGKEEPTEAEAVAVIKKFIKNALETLKVAESDHVKQELAILESFLPKQLSEDELRALITNFADEGLDIGDAMKRLKTQFAGMYDGALASKLMKELLK